jgi:hypothetical protein
LDSSLVGYVRSFRKAGACARLASAAVTPASWDSPALVIAHPPMCVSGNQGRLCNQHLPLAQGPPTPVGHYVLVADFELDCSAGGVCNAHAAADFSPDTALPAEWVRMRDPFQGVSKKSFGFTLVLNASAPGSTPTTSAAANSVRRAAFTPKPSGTPRVTLSDTVPIRLAR